MTQGRESDIADRPTVAMGRGDWYSVHAALDYLAKFGPDLAWLPRPRAAWLAERIQEQTNDAI